MPQRMRVGVCRPAARRALFCRAAERKTAVSRNAACPPVVSPITEISFISFERNFVNKEFFMADQKNYYEILGVDKKATDAEIKAAYRKLVKQYHPCLLYTSITGSFLRSPRISSVPPRMPFRAGKSGSRPTRNCTTSSPKSFRIRGGNANAGQKGFTRCSAKAAAS